jgi:hypothetical protein
MTEKSLPPSPKCLSRAAQTDMSMVHFFEIISEDIPYEDIFHPAFWRHHKNLKPFTMIRLRRSDGAFDVDVTVRTVVASGAVVEFRGGRPPIGIDPYKIENSVRAEAMRQQVAPIGADGQPVIRVQYLPKTKYRVLGLGSEEIERDIPSKEIAETRMAIYLNTINMRNPTEEEILAEVRRRATAVAAANAKASAPAA